MVCLEGCHPGAQHLRVPITIWQTNKRLPPAVATRGGGGGVVAVGGTDGAAGGGTCACQFNCTHWQRSGNVYIMWLWPKTATGSEGVGCSVSVCVCLARLIACSVENKLWQKFIVCRKRITTTTITTTTQKCAHC